jgi:hypothetical protein
LCKSCRNRLLTEFDDIISLIMEQIKISTKFSVIKVTSGLKAIKVSGDENIFGHDTMTFFEENRTFQKKLDHSPLIENYQLNRSRA